ncbi:MAG TPA: PAS domain S-box protein [Nitrospira sp.]|nr:PAS domain S-box protein [Nitrospira sp.]
MKSTEKEWLLGAAILTLLSSLFILDIYTPLGFANHFLYAAAVLIAALSRLPFLLLPVVAGAGTVLTVVAAFISQALPGVPLWIPVGNRTFTIVILWVLVWFAWKRRQAEDALTRANEGLEQNVLNRTRQLAAVNQALVSEVTERMQAERALLLSEARLAGLLDIAEDAIIVIGQDRKVTLYNKGAQKLFGYEAEEVLGESIDRLLPERFRADHAQHIDVFAEAPEASRRMAQRREVFGVRKDGTEFPAEASISKLHLEGNVMFTVILRDITDRVRTEHQLQSLATQLMTAQDEERRRISRELHDDINQRLALLAIEMGQVETSTALSVDRVREALRAMAQQLASISDDVRRMAYQFHPSIVDDLGLTSGLARLAQEFSEKTGIKTVVVQEEPPEPLPREVASCLYRIAQESLLNVKKHAGASRVEIELTCDNRGVMLSIHDSGVGFDPERLEARPMGLGLINMRERVRSVRGRLDIRSQIGQGTRISVHIPLPGVRDEETTSPAGR